MGDGSFFILQSADGDGEARTPSEVDRALGPRSPTAPESAVTEAIWGLGSRQEGRPLGRGVVPSRPTSPRTCLTPPPPCNRSHAHAPHEHASTDGMWSLDAARFRLDRGGPTRPQATRSPCGPSFSGPKIGSGNDVENGGAHMEKIGIFSRVEFQRDTYK